MTIVSRDRPPWHRLLAFGLAWITVSGVLVGLLLAFGAGRAGLGEILRSSAIATIYAACIGIPAWLILTPVADRLWERSIALQLAAAAGIMVVLCVVGSLFAGLVLIATALSPPEHYWAQFSGGVRIAFVVGFIMTALAYATAALRHRAELAQRLAREHEDAKRRAERLADETRLAALAARIHPHFLFNTLNTIAALIPDDPDRAEAVVDRLAALLRAALDRDGDALVSVHDERRIVEDYLDIQRARFGDRLGAEIDIADELVHLLVPPFCLQTLVENAVVHAASTRTTPTTLGVRARRRDGALVLEVCDDGPGFSPSDVPKGRGLSTLGDRLDALYGGDAALEICPDTRGVCVRVRVPIRSPEIV